MPAASAAHSVMASVVDWFNLFLLCFIFVGDAFLLERRLHLLVK